MTPLTEFKKKIAQLVVPHGYEIVYNQADSICYYAAIKCYDTYHGIISNEKWTDTWRVYVNGRGIATDYEDISSAIRKLLT